MMKAFNHTPTEEELTLLTTQCQTQHGGKMTFQVFSQIMAPRIVKANEAYAEDKILAAFRRFDADEDGYITAKELRTVLLESFCPGMKRVAEALTDDDVDEIMSEADLDGDGRISFSEFKAMIPQLSSCIHTQVKIR